MGRGKALCRHRNQIVLAAVAALLLGPLSAFATEPDRSSSPLELEGTLEGAGRDYTP